MKVIGLDCGSDGVVCCILDSLPPDLVSFANKYKPIKQPPTSEGVQKIAELGEVFAIEPTGSWHWFWYEELEKLGKLVLLCSGLRIRHFAIEKGFLNKSDSEDAVAIAAYTWVKLTEGNSHAFVRPPSTELRRLYLAARSIPKAKTVLTNQFRARLGYEMPILAKTASADRGWLEAEPPAITRAIAGETLRRRSKKIEEGLHPGREISFITRRFAQLVCEMERLELEIEKAIEHELETAHDWMDGVFDEWTIPPKQRAIIRAIAHPFEQFLEPDGKRLVEKKWNSQRTRRNRRDRSLKRWKRMFAAGTRKVQSGQKTSIVQTGDKRLASDLRILLRIKVIMARQPTSIRLHKLYGMDKDEWAAMNKKQQAAWLKEREFRNVLNDVVKPVSDTYLPWKDEAAIAKVQWYNGSSRGFAKLQLYFEYAPCCQNIRSHTALNRKIFPRFLELLFSDLHKAYKAFAADPGA